MAYQKKQYQKTFKGKENARKLSKPLTYVGQKTVLGYMDANIRFNFATKSKSIRKTEKATQLFLKNLVFDHNKLTINDKTMHIGIHRHYLKKPIPETHQAQNDKGGIHYDLDQYGFRHLAADNLLLAGDIRVEEAGKFDFVDSQDDARREELEEWKAHYEKELEKENERLTLEGIERAESQKPKNLKRRYSGALGEKQVGNSGSNSDAKDQGEAVDSENSGPETDAVDQEEGIDVDDSGLESRIQHFESLEHVEDLKPKDQGGAEDPEEIEDSEDFASLGSDSFDEEAEIQEMEEDDFPALKEFVTVWKKRKSEAMELRMHSPPVGVDLEKYFQSGQASDVDDVEGSEAILARNVPDPEDVDPEIDDEALDEELFEIEEAVDDAPPTNQERLFVDVNDYRIPPVKLKKYIDQLETALNPFYCRLENRAPNFEQHLKLTITTPHGKLIQRWRNACKLHEAIRIMYSKTLGGRKPIILVHSMTIWLNYKVLRVPYGLKIRVKKLKIMGFITKVFDDLRPIFCEKSFPLELLETEIVNEKDLDHPFIESAKKLVVSNDLFILDWSKVLRNMENQRVHYKYDRFEEDDFAGLIESWQLHSQNIGICHTFAIRNLTMWSEVKWGIEEEYENARSSLNWILVPINFSKEILVGYFQFSRQESVEYGLAFRVVPSGMSNEEIGGTIEKDAEETREMVS